MEEIPNWMEKYIPAMMEQWNNNTSLVLSKIDLMYYRESLSESLSLQKVFDINMNIKIGLLKIINESFKLN